MRTKWRGATVIALVLALLGLTLLASGDARACTQCAVAQAVLGANDSPPSCPPAATTGPALCGELRVGGALGGVPSYPDYGVPSCAAVECKLKLKRLLGPMDLKAEIFHPFSGGYAFFWDLQKRACFGVDLNLSKDCQLFGEFRRNYALGTNTWWGGVCLKFGQ